MIRKRIAPDNCHPRHRAQLLYWFILVFGILLGAFLLFSEEGEGRTIIVDDYGEAEYTRIQDAIDNSTDGDTIRVWAGVYNESIRMNRSLSLIGNGTETTFLIGQHDKPTISVIANNSVVSEPA